MNPEIKKIIDHYNDFWFKSNDIYEKWAKKRGLTVNSLFTLYIIYYYPDACTQQFICEKLFFPKQTVNTILDTFQKKGYIKKVSAEKDRRSKYILLTATGQTFADDILSKLYRFEETALLSMSASERKFFVKVTHSFIEKLSSALENEKSLPL